MTEVGQDKATCYHEAAHAVSAVKVCGGEVRYVDADERYCAGAFRNYGGWVDCWREAMYALAGWLAEELAIEGEVRPESWELLYEGAEVEDELGEEHGDLSAIVDCLAHMGDAEEEYRIVVGDIEQHARELWPQSTAVAEALLVKRWLEGDEVARLIETVGGKGGA